MNKIKILYVEDEPFLGKIVKESLESRDFEVKMVADGRLKPHVSAVLPLQDIQKAHAMIEGRHTRGKIVLQVVN